MSDSDQNAVEKANSLLKRADELLRDVIENIRPADERAMAQGTHWIERHRLLVLIDGARRVTQAEEVTVRDLWKLSELDSTLTLIERWRHVPGWEHEANSLLDRRGFTHAVLVLNVAEYFTMNGYSVEFVPPRGQEGTATPDLRILPSEELKRELFVECFQPVRMTLGEPMTAKQARKIADDAMDKGRRQLPTNEVGFLAIGGYNQQSRDIRTLASECTKRLSKTHRVDLVGLLIVTMNTLVQADNSPGGIISASAARTVRIIENPEYFGDVDVVSDGNIFLDHTLGSLYEVPLGDVTLLSNRDTGRSYVTADDVEAPTEVRVLTPAETIDLEHDSLVISDGEAAVPLFEGDGRYDYACHCCGAILARRVSSWSINNIHVKCFYCDSVNATAKFEIPSGMRRRTLLTAGTYHFGGPCNLRRGVYVVGGMTEEIAGALKEMQSETAERED